MLEYFKGLQPGDFSKESRSEKFIKGFKYALFSAFAIINAVSTSALGSSNNFYSNSLFWVSIVCLLLSALMLYFPAKETNKQRIINAIVRKHNSSIKSKNLLYTALLLLACTGLFCALLFGAGLPLFYVEIGVVTCFFLFKTLIDIYAPSKFEQVKAGLDDVDLYFSALKDKGGATKKAIEDKKKSGWVRRGARIFGALNAVFANGLLTISGFSGSINGILDRLFGIKNAFMPGISNIPGFQLAIYSVLFFVGVYVSYSLTKESIEAVFYSVVKKISQWKESGGVLTGMRTQWSRILYGLYSVGVGGGLTYLVCYKGLYATMLTQWQLPLAAANTLMVIVCIFTFVAGSCLLGRAVFKGINKDFFDRIKKIWREIIIAVICATSVYFLATVHAAAYQLPLGIISGISLACVFSLVFYQLIKANGKEKMRLQLAGFGAVIAVFAAGSYMLAMVPASNVGLQILFGALALLCAPAWFSLFFNSSWFINLNVEKTDLLLEGSQVKAESWEDLKFDSTASHDSSFEDTFPTGILKTISVA